MEQPVSDSNWITVFRSAEHSAEEEAAAACELLKSQGLRAEVADASAAGFPFGTWEVQVAAADSTRAEEILATMRPVSAQPGDASHDMDLVTVFSSDTHTAEMEAMEIQGILESTGIPTVLVASGPFPSLPFEVRVPSARAGEATRVMAEFQAAGPAAAEEAEKAEEASERPE